MKKYYVIICLLFFTGFGSVEALPKINFSVYPAIGTPNTEFTVDAKDSRNSAGNSYGLDLRCQYSNNLKWTKWTNRLYLKFKNEKTGNNHVKCQIKDHETGTIQTTYRDYLVKKNVARQIRIIPSKNSLTVGEDISFELKIVSLLGENQDKILARWDFNSDGIWETNFSRKKNVSYAYDKTGQVTPTVEVKFMDGQIIKVHGIGESRRDGIRTYQLQRQKINISPQILYPPIVNIFPGTKGYTEKTFFSFDASKSKIPRLGWLEWSIDGQQWMKFPNKKEVRFNFHSPGKHEVRTRTCLGKYNLKCAETKTTVFLEKDPLDFSAQISLQNRTNAKGSYVYNKNINHYVPVEVGDLVRFSVITTRYGNVGKLKYRWDFNSDGKWDTDFSKSNFTETNFDHLGEFNVTAEIQSEDSVIVFAKKKIKVNINPKPVVYIVQNPAKIFVGERVRFFPKYFSDYTDSVRFDIDNDGFWESDFRGISSQEWVFEKPGKTVIKAQIRDKGGNVTTVEKEVYVNFLPSVEAKVTVSKKYIKAGESLFLDASESTGRNLRYFWDFDSTGEYNLANWEYFRAGPMKISRNFKTKGKRYISLKIIDEIGNSDQIFFPVFVE